VQKGNPKTTTNAQTTLQRPTTTQGASPCTPILSHVPQNFPYFQFCPQLKIKEEREKIVKKKNLQLHCTPCTLVNMLLL